MAHPHETWPTGRWRFWDEFAVRGAGFPVDGVLSLAPHGLALAADRFLPGDDLAGTEWASFEKTFHEAAVKTALTMQEHAAETRFRTAITWQNRGAVTSGLEPFLRWNPAVGRTSQPRQREDLIANYLQRFCVKNDTIGFFGPVGWGRWDRSSSGLEVGPGEDLIAETNVYFASWAIDGLAAVIGADPAFREWIAPRRVPFVRLEGRKAVLPGRPAQELGPHLAHVLERCDGTSSARAIRAELGHGPGLYADLDELVRRRLIVWRLDIPADARPEHHLRSWLEQVGDPFARRRGLDQLKVLERGRDRVREAVDPDELSAALAGLEADFATLTGGAGVRQKGGTTAPGRALVYSDCRRAGTVRLGSDMLSAMAPLDPLLTSASWLTWNLADRVRQRVREVFDRTGRTDLATFWFACMPILHGAAVSDALALRQEFWTRWAEVLALPPDSHRVQLSLSEVGPRAQVAFDCLGGGWLAARYLSPDLMIAADGLEAVQRGDFELVLGELHVAMNTLGTSLFVHQHEHPDDLLTAITRDHPGPRLLPLLAKENKARLSTRIRQTLVRPEDYYVALMDFTAPASRPRTLPSADVMVDLQDGQLVAVLPDGATFDVMDVFSHVLTTLVVDHFQILPEDDHTPRVSLDKMVVARETWRFRAGDLAFAAEKSEAQRFVRTRQWQSQQALPRFVFVTSATEPRPMFVDLESPSYVNIFAKAVRRMANRDEDAKMTVTEMLPTPAQTWLADGKGNRYTSELRFVAYDTADGRL